MFQKNLRIPVAMMAISLLLLVGFIGWFLHNAWQAAFSSFQTEADLLMSQTVRTIETEAFQKIMNSVQGIDSISVQNVDIKQQDKELKRVVIFQKHDTIQHTSFDKSSLRKERKRLNMTFERADNAAPGIVSTLIQANLQGDSTRINIMPDTAVLGEKLKTGIKTGLAEKGMSIEFILDKKPLETAPANNVATTYSDLNSQTRYEMSLRHYHAYIARRILPEILFSLFLFVVTSLAFYLIIRHLRAQHRLNEIKGEFTRNITHELKTPVATATVAIEALLDFGGINDPARTREYLEISKMELNRLSLLVDRVLKMSAFDEQDQVVQKVPTDLQALAENVLATLQPRLKERQAQVDFRAEGAPYEVMGDRLHLANMLYNLLDNALKYSPNQPKIGLRLLYAPNKLTITVIDQGIGIPEAYRHKVLDKYFRVPTGDVHNVKGHGLGLSYVASVVAAHGGTIAVAGNEGGGTVVQVDLNAQLPIKTNAT
jgi:signal transduction histidine kinase